MSLIASLVLVWAGTGTARTAIAGEKTPADEVRRKLAEIGEKLSRIEGRLEEENRNAAKPAPLAAAASAATNAAATNAAATNAAATNAAAGKAVAYSSWLPSEPLEGRIVFEEKNCAVCHSISGSGGNIGPDLTKTYFHGSFLDLASMLWNHLPDMAIEYKALKLPQPRFTDEEVKSLISYLYYLRYLGNPGSVSKGEKLLEEKGCLNCHGARQEDGSPVGPELARIKEYASPIYMAQAIWNHEPQMQAMMDKMKIPRPTFDGQEISDLSAYMRAVSRKTNQQRFYLSPGNPEAGKKVFEGKGCVKCHSGGQGNGSVGPSLEALPLQKSASEIAGMMWNHGDEMLRTMKAGKIPWPILEGKEMADLIAYLYFIRFIDPPGDAANGKMLFQEKQCASCHSIKGVGGKFGPDLAQSPALSSNIATLRAMLNHSEEMSEAILDKGKIWPLLDGKEMRDIFSYLGMVSGRRVDVVDVRGGRVAIGGGTPTTSANADTGPALQEPAPQEPSPQETTPQEPPTPQDPTPQEPAPQDPAPQEPAPQEPAAQEPLPKESIPAVARTSQSNLPGVPENYDTVDALLLMTPGESLIEKLKNALGEEQTKRVTLAFYLSPECISKGDFAWSPRKTAGSRKIRIFIPTLIQAQVTVTLDGKTVWKPDAKEGTNILSPEIDIGTDELKLIIKVEDRGSDDDYGGVDDIYILRPKPTDQ